MSTEQSGFGMPTRQGSRVCATFAQKGRRHVHPHRHGGDRRRSRRIRRGFKPPRPWARRKAPPAAVQVVRRLYAHKLTPTHVAGVFARDLARAYRKDIGHPGEVGEIDFDWRYGAQDFEITELKVEATHLDAAGAMPMADRGEVRATFKNFGKPYEVLYRVCRSARAGGGSPTCRQSAGTAKWDLRQMLHLDPDKVRC